MDPRIRETLIERLARLGVNAEALESGKGGEVLANIMMSRMGHKQAPAAAGIASQNAGAKTGISLDKGWHGVHYLLCGAAEPSATAVGHAVMGGTEAVDSRIYGASAQAGYAESAV